MSDLEKWGLIAVLVVLSALVVAMMCSVRALRREVDANDDMIKMTDRMFTDRYWNNSHNITLLMDYLGVHVEERQPTRKLVKKGGPEQGT